MARPSALSVEQVAAALEALPDWSGGTGGIRRTIREVSFLAAAERVVEMAGIAEEMDHHPDVDIRYRTLTVFLVTHSVGGVTELDLEFAHRLDELLVEDSQENPGPELQRAFDLIDQAFAKGRQRKKAQPGSGA